MATASSNSGAPKNEDDQDEEVDEQHYMSVKDAVLFAIEINSSMLRKPPASEDKKADRDCAAIAALKCAHQLMQQRIISNPNDKMGIVLFGTELSKFGDDNEAGGPQFPHCYLLMDLDRPSAEDIKQIRSIVADEEEANALLVPSKEPPAMSNLLFCANQIFTTRAQNFTSRRLFLVTDNDAPHAQDKDLKSAAVIRAKDLYDLGVTIELFPIAQPGKDFDTSKFYDDIVYRPPADPEAPAPISRSIAKTSNNDGISLLQSLITAIYQKVVPKRALFSNLPLEFGPDFKISVKGYIIFKRQEPKRSTYIYADGEKAVLAEGKTNFFAEEGGRSLEKVEIRKAFKFGGENVLFTPEEAANITYFGDPIIRIIGFKPLTMLPSWANCRPATFIYPSEEEFVGSTRTFSALQQVLLRQHMMGLVWFIPRRNSTPTIAAMIPGPEKVGQAGEQILPPGLWIRPLPYTDDIRNNPEINETIRAPDILKDKMRPVVERLQLPKAEYDPSRYPNPALQWHYRILQAMALNEDMPTEPEDKTIPRYRQIDKRAGPFVIEWGNALQEEFSKWRLENKNEVVGGKRATPSAGASSAPKKTKSAGDAADALTDEYMRNQYNKNQLSKLTVQQLKTWLKSKNLDVAGRKHELADRVENFFDNKMSLD